jgi:Rrf2 family iron-sulfur cluster assembly transcriptional regulator
LAKPVEAISVTDIIRAVDEALDATRCGGRGDCEDDHPCMTHVLWSSLNQRMFDYLSSVQLAELVEQQRSTKCAEGVEKTPPARRPARRIPVAAVA